MTFSTCHFYGHRFGEHRASILLLPCAPCMIVSSDRCNPCHTRRVTSWKAMVTARSSGPQRSRYSKEKDTQRTCSSAWNAYRFFLIGLLGSLSTVLCVPFRGFQPIDAEHEREICAKRGRQVRCQEVLRVHLPVGPEEFLWSFILDTNFTQSM